MLFNKFINNNEKYTLDEYEISINKDKSFSITYFYKTPTYIWHALMDDYVKGNTRHIYEEFYDPAGNVYKTKCRLRINNSKEYNSNGKCRKTNYNKDDIKKQVEKDREDMLKVILKDNLYKKEYTQNKKLLKISYFCGLTLFYNNLDLPVEINYDRKNNKISKLTYYENNKRIQIQFKKDSDTYSLKILENDFLKTSFCGNMIETNFEDGSIKRYPRMKAKEYEIEFSENGYHICPKNKNKELYSYAGMRIDKYPLVQKNKPDNSYGTVTLIQSSKCGGFLCNNILGLPIGGQLDNGTTYLYLYHNDRSYIKTYSDGDNRYYNKSGDWDRTVKVEVESNGNHKLIFQNGKIKRYNIYGNREQE